MYEQLHGALRSRLGESRGLPPPVPAGWTVDVDPDEVPGDGLSSEGGLRGLAGSAFLIGYVDARGRASSRRITIHRVWREAGDEFNLRAWCHERQAPRMFKASRIGEMVDLATGEVIEDAVEFLAMAVGDAVSGTPEDVARAAVNRLRDELNVLAFIARADGKLHRREAAAMQDYVLAHADGRASEREIRRHIGGLWPDSEAFSDSLRSVLRRGTSEEVGELFGRIVEVIESDGVLSSEERALIYEIRNAAREAGVPL